MKERNDPAQTPESAEETTGARKDAADSAAGAAEDAVSEATQETKPFSVIPEEEPKATPHFRVRKRQADGTWKNRPVHVTDAAQQPKSFPKREKVVTLEEPERLRTKPVPSRRSRRLRRGVAAAVAAVVLIAVVSFSIYMYRYPSIFPGVHAGEYSLKGMSQAQAEKYLSGEGTDDMRSHDITVEAEGQEFTLHVGDVADTVDSADSAKAAYRVGREGGYFHRAGEILTAMFGGQNVPMGIQVDSKALSRFVNDVYEKVEYDPTQPSWKVDKKAKKLIVDTGKQGLSFDRDTVKQALKEQIETMDYDAYTVETYATDQDKPDAAKIAKDVNCKPQNAKADPETGEVVDSVTGVEVSEDAIAKTIGNAKKQTYEIPVKLTKAEMSAKALKKVLFRDVLAQTTTMYNSGDAGRTTNVSLTAQACDGTILNPGDEFSYNDTVGERTPERGYQTATIFVAGESVEDYGGGACQSSSTIYMAVLRADLKVTERRNHQFQISYTPISQDATVAWGSQDFKFVNSTKYPIKISMDMGGGSLTCTIYGTKTDDKEVSLYSESYTSGDYKYATLYKTVTVNGKSETKVENESAYLLKEKSSDQ